MLRLLKAEIYKLFRNKAFKVLCIISVLLAFMFIGMTKLVSSESFIKSNLKGMTQEQQDQFMQQLKGSNDHSIVTAGGMGMHIDAKDTFHPTSKEVFHSSFGAGIIEILMAVLIGAMVAGEYSSGTIKNILAYGKKREYYYIAKMLAISIALIILLGIMVSVTTIGCSFLFPWGETFNITSVLHIVKIFIGATLVEMSVVSIIMLLATVLKSNGSTIGIGIVIFTVCPTVISFLYGKYAWFDKIYEATPAYNWALVTSIRAANSDVFKAITVGLITMIIATVAGIVIFKKQDIK